MRPGQSRATLLMAFTDKHAANLAIRDGLIIMGKRMFGRKWLPEPRRCGRCLAINPRHQTRDCPQIHDTCGICGKLDHISHDCTETKADRMRCANCRRYGHSTFDKKCPSHQEALRQLLLRNPDSRYRFFVDADDPATWMLQDSREFPFPTPSQPSPFPPFAPSPRTR